MRLDGFQDLHATNILLARKSPLASRGLGSDAVEMKASEDMDANNLK